MTKRIKLGETEPITRFKELNFCTDYESFDDFYSENKPEIYKSIVEIFEEFKKPNITMLSLGLSSTITGIYWTTHIDLYKEQYFILKRDVLPFFEENEDYETCIRINKIYNELLTT